MEPRRLALALEGLPNAAIEVIGGRPSGDGRHIIEIGPDQTRELRVLVTTHEGPKASALAVDFVVSDADGGGESVRASDNFRGP
jgi:hypothetical protein